MKRGFFVLLLLVFSFSEIFSQIPAGYYTNAEGLSGDALKSALNDIIDGHTERTYDQAKYDLRVTDEDPNNSDNVICLYTGWSYAKSAWNSGSEGWNREHVWSKSHGDFGTTPPAGTDLHHLRPADISVNSTKNNRDFDYGTEAVIDGSGETGCYYATDVWEPRDSEKGDVARMIFYMATRYEGENGEVDLELVDYVYSDEGTKQPFYGKLSTLLEWHSLDPVDAWEINRNNIIYTDYQHNRNPYIDHPEYVDLIWGGSSQEEPSNHVSSFAVTATTLSSITLSWDDNDGEHAASKYLLMINSTNSFTTPVDGTEQSDDTDISDGSGIINVNHGVETYTFAGLTAGNTYYFKIFPYSNFGTNVDYKTDGIVPTTNAIPEGSGNVLIISEVSDPKDVYSARYVEIYNPGNTTINFSNEIWYLCRQANGDGWANIQLEGTINAKETYVVTYSSTSFTSSYGSTANLSNGNVSGNGDDGYFLYADGNYLTGTLIDAYGVINVDGTDEDWDYEDSKAVRKYPITSPSATWNYDEWEITSNSNVANMTPKWHRQTLSWSGAASSTWENKENWSEGRSAATFSPDASSKLILTQSGISPVITTDTYCGYLELGENATLTISSGTLTVGN